MQRGVAVPRTVVVVLEEVEEKGVWQQEYRAL